MRHAIRIFAAASAVVLAMSSASGAVPFVTEVTMAQASDSRLVTITYKLSDAPAVVTLDVQTNNSQGAWTSIGGAAVCNAQGDVWKAVAEGPDVKVIKWRPDLSWPDHAIPDGGARAVVTAWDLANTPDYMIVDISSAAMPDTQRYYPGAAFVPGGVTNDLYKTTMLAMRKIMAKDVTWTMGSVAESGRGANEATHQVSLTNNYYIGVYEITQAQWMSVVTNGTRQPFFLTGGATRPMEAITFNDIRAGNSGSIANGKAFVTEYAWPNDPHQKSFLGLLRSKTGIDFDLPSEAQWEFACRAGHGEGKWGDGSICGDGTAQAQTNGFRLARCKDGPDFTYKYFDGNSTYRTQARSLDTSYGTDYVGNHAPNDWGLYDMHGNVAEYCLDWYQADISAYEGALNVNPADSTQRLDGTAGSKFALRGGSFYSGCRSALRSSVDAWLDPRNGLRVMCRAGLR